MTVILTVATAHPTRLIAEPKHLPAGTRVGVGTPGEAQCYDVVGFKELLKLDSQFSSAEQMNDLLSQKTAEQDNIIQYQQEEIKIRANTALILQTENTRLFEQWKDENKKRLEAENRPSWTPSWIPWAVAGAAVVAAGVLGGVLVLQK